MEPKRTEDLIITACCECGLVKMENDSWEAYTPKSNEQISHSYCPACAEQAFSQLREEIELNRKYQEE